MEKTGILVVSFGTSYKETRAKTIDKIVQEIQKRFAGCDVYEAWTSRRIAAKVQESEGRYIPSVAEALEQMKRDGIRNVIVQPTHVINGIENDKMKEEVASYASSFAAVAVGDPILTSEADKAYVVKHLAEEMYLPKPQALVLMGHGTEHQINKVYAQMDDMFKQSGHDNVFLGTVEAAPSLNDVMKSVKKTKAKKVVLAPFMIVAGDHAINDLCGEEEDSWKSQFEKAGYQVEGILKGLGEYTFIHELLKSHTLQAMESISA